MDVPVSGAPLLIPPEETTLRELKRLCSDGDVKLKSFSTLTYQDPIIVLEILREANTLALAGGIQTLDSLDGAIMRIGWESVNEMLKRVGNRPRLGDAGQRKWLEHHRSRCRRTGMVARIVAEEISKVHGNKCHLAALFLFMGEIVAVTQLGRQYVNLADSLPRSKVNYRLISSFNFDVEGAGFSYLTRQGLPQSILSILNREIINKKLGNSMMRPAIFSAAELVGAFDNSKIERYKTLDSLPSNTPLRHLKLSATQYQNIFEKSYQYLNSLHALDSEETLFNKTNFSSVSLPRYEDIDTSEQENKPTQSLNEKENNVPEVSLSKITEGLKQKLSKALEEKNAEQEASIRQEKVENVEIEAAAESFDSAHNNVLQRFGLIDTPAIRQKLRAHKTLLSDPAPAQKKNQLSNRSAEKLSTITQVVTLAVNSEQLLALILELLVQQGFARSALIVVADSKTEGIIISSRGEHLNSGTIFEISDSYSPFVLQVSKVLSSNTSKSVASPFGSTTYAVAPLSADHSTGVCLYADCGINEIISFEARRIFRYALDAVNAKLPQLPGGLPIDFELEALKDSRGDNA